MQLILALALLGGLLVAGGMLLRPTRPSHLRGGREGSVVVLRPPRGRYTVLGAMALGPSLLVVVVAAAAARREAIGPAGVALVALVAAAGFAVSAYLLLAERKMRVRVDAAGVERVDPFRRSRIGWGDVERLTYNGVSRWFYLSGAGGARLWIPENMAGIGDFAEAALEHVPGEVVRADGATHEALQQIAAEALEEDASGAGANR
jgi:Bacterial PH domain